ncbi:MFS transporter [Actinoplanes sp. TRM 88003]|uniref:MFS transporter n=1 Tax=Paractinoplanes aksuensis TaxID=2939490 RepID=A0ABT1DZV6_9ACTN|nr:MFS transporter [Actinoplanes aksuensis]MCO8276103.1 MFS transporter [Actinoplanes aksuensis]
MQRNALLFVLISLLSGFGSTAMTLAAGIWVFDLTGSVSLAALTAVCTYAPTLAAPWLGALVDRLPRRPLVIGVDLALGAALLTLLAVRSAGAAWLIFAVLLARGVSYVLSDAGESAILPSALSPKILADVNGWRSSAQEGMKLVAPLAGATLYAWRGPVAVVVLCAAMPLLTAACYALLRLAPVRPAPQVERGLRPGLRALFGVPAVRDPVLVAGAAIGASGLTNAAVLAHVVHDLGRPATHLGYLGTAQGAGSIVAGLVIGRLLARRGPVTVAAAGAAIFAAGCLLQALPWWPTMIAGSVVIGVGLVWALIAAVTAVQTRTPEHLLGRVAATSNTVMFGPVALGIPLGAAAVHLGAVVPLALAALVSAAAAAMALRAARVPSVVSRG